MPISVRDHEPAELASLVAVAARAFWNDPLYNYFQPNLLVQHRHLDGLFGAAIHDCARHGEVQSASIDLDGIGVHGVAAWLPPGVADPTSIRRTLATLRRVIPSMAFAGHRREGVRLLKELQRAAPPVDAWHLVALAADPRVQRRGIGTALLRPVLERCDRDGFSVHLETQKPENLVYYRRFGFGVSRVIDGLGCPPLWLLVREPR